MVGLEILALAPGATIQDVGRLGYRRYGVTKGGAMDPYGLREGQVLLGNPAHSAALEMAFQGGQFRSIGNNIVACTGAEMSLRVNDHSVGWRQVISLNDGDQLSIGACLEGCYGYLHLLGGIDAPLVLGSRSAHVQADLGWKPNPCESLRPLARGPASFGEGQKKIGYCLTRPSYFDDRVVRILEGPQTHLFAKRDVASLEKAEWQITNVRNRMGARLKSSSGALKAEWGATMASDAIVMGDIQVAADGIPAVLLADCQPIGGYPKIATVISADIHKLAQIPVDMLFKMKMVRRSTAIKEWESLISQMNQLSDQRERAVRNPKDMRDLLKYSLIDGVISGEE